MDFQDQPYALKSEQERIRRCGMLALSHIQPLNAYLEEIKIDRGPGYEMPCFDPCDGGTAARVLFLLEAPGPKAVGSTFISRNNPDPTARNMAELLSNAGIRREDTLIWNIVPWYVGDGQRIRAVTRRDILTAAPYLKWLIELLPNLEVIVLVGKKAQGAEEMIRTFTNKLIVHTFHPSARVFNVWPDKKRSTQEAFNSVARLLSNDHHSSCPNSPPA